MQKYTSYRVDVRAPAGQDLNQQQGAFSAVLRRYSDFVWLSDRLHVERAGAIVPPLPDKQPVGRFSPAFIEERRMGLELFLRRCALHPELHDAQSLSTFLRADDVTFHAAKKQGGEAVVGGLNASMMQQQMGGGYGSQMMASPAKKEASGFKKWFAETKTSMTGDLVRSPDDELFDEINRYVHALDSQMKNVTTQASNLVRKGKEISNGLFEFGLAFSMLGQSEADALGQALGKLGQTADQLSVVSAEHAQKEGQSFEDPLVDMIKTIHSVKLALQRRHEKRLSYSTCLSEAEAKNQQLYKLRSQIGMEAKAYATEMSLRRAQEACQVAQNEFMECSQRVLREVDRFKRETADEMRRTVMEYIQLQVDYNKHMEQVWATLIPELEKVQLDGNANIVGENGAPVPAAVAPPTDSSIQSTSQQAPAIAPPVAQQQQPQMHSQPMISSPNPQQAQQQQYYNLNAPPPPAGAAGGGDLNLQYRPG